MTYINAETRQRNAYVDHMVESAIEQIGGVVIPLSPQGEEITVESMLSRVFVPNIQHGIATIETLDDQETVPIIPIMKGEGIRLGHGFAAHTERQRVAAIQIASKQFIGANPERLVDSAMLGLQQSVALGQSPELRIHQGASAVTSALSSVFDRRIALEMSGGYGNPNSFGIGQMLGRSAVLIPVLSEGADMPVLAHELTHQVQKQTSPLAVYYSQKDVDDRGLRTELEAYHTGAAATEILLSVSSNQVVGSEATLNMQQKIEALRSQLNTDGQKPFRPHSDFFKLASRQGITIDAMLHGRINFAQFATAMQHQAKVTRSNPFVK